MSHLSLWTKDYFEREDGDEVPRKVIKKKKEKKKKEKNDW